MKLGIITNGTVRIQEPAIQRLDLLDLMDTIHISEREGLRKPDEAIFTRAVAALGLTPGEAWYVGDHPDVDVRGAVSAGLEAIWRCTSYWPEPDAPHRKIDDLNDLLSFIHAAG